jgi:hypothetical protein
MDVCGNTSVLIHGKRRSGKTRYCIDEIARINPSFKNVFVFAHECDAIVWRRVVPSCFVYTPENLDVAIDIINARRDAFAKVKGGEISRAESPTIVFDAADASRSHASVVASVASLGCMRATQLWVTTGCRKAFDEGVIKKFDYVVDLPARVVEDQRRLGPPVVFPLSPTSKL